MHAFQGRGGEQKKVIESFRRCDSTNWSSKLASQQSKKKRDRLAVTPYGRGRSVKVICRHLQRKTHFTANPLAFPSSRTSMDVPIAGCYSAAQKRVIRVGGGVYVCARAFFPLRHATHFAPNTWIRRALIGRRSRLRPCFRPSLFGRAVFA